MTGTMATENGQPCVKTILIVDDHPLVRRGLTALIESEPDLVVGGEAATRRAALETISHLQPDLAIVDLALGEDDGLTLITQIRSRHPEVPILVLSMYDESVYAERSMRAGATGYVTKQQLDDTLLNAIRCLLAGEMYLSADLQRQMVAKFIGGQTLETDSPLKKLSNRELQVFRLIGQGRTTREIAGILQLSIKTIESHRSKIKNKLALSSSAELAQSAAQWVGTFGRTA
jgi:DNA-binding NarL/FixJ family response regulator